MHNRQRLYPSNIVELEHNAKLVYQMKESNVWCKSWVSFLQDSFILSPIENNQTKVTRITEFRGVNSIPVLSTLALWFSLKQAHRNASKNWRRLSLQTKQSKS